MIKSYLKWLSPRFQMFTGAYDLRKAAMIVQAREYRRLQDAAAAGGLEGDGHGVRLVVHQAGRAALDPDVRAVVDEVAVGVLTEELRVDAAQPVVVVDGGEAAGIDRRGDAVGGLGRRLVA